MITALLCATLFAAPATRPADAAAEVAPSTQPATQPATEMLSYGEPVPTNKMAPLPLSEVLADPEKFADRQIWIEGTIEDVCAKAGCWMQITGEGTDKALFIKFTCPIEGRLIPMEAIGRRAQVAGEVVIKEIDEATARHYAEDAGASAEEIEAIKGPQTQITMDSPFALIAAE
ncbi:MAG: DUF4920 domain-containing protein [Planctomycetota bacterium]